MVWKIIINKLNINDLSAFRKMTYVLSFFLRVFVNFTTFPFLINVGVIVLSKFWVKFFSVIRILICRLHWYGNTKRLLNFFFFAKCQILVLLSTSYHRKFWLLLVLEYWVRNSEYFEEKMRIVYDFRRKNACRDRKMRSVVMLHPVRVC